MENVSLGGRTVPGFALGQPVGVGDASATVSPVYASVMTGAAAGLLAYVLSAPVWGAIVAGAAVATTTKYAIDRSA